MAFPYDVASAYQMQPLSAAGLQPPQGGLYLPDAQPQQAMGALVNPVPQQPDMSQVSTGQLSPFGHVGDVANQYIVNQQQKQDGGGLLSQILAQRFQPTFEDVNKSAMQTAKAFGAPDLYKPATPQDIAQQRMTQQFAPYTTMLGLQEQQANVGLKQAQAMQATSEANLYNKFLGNSGGAANGNTLPPGTSMNGSTATTPGFNVAGAFMAHKLGLPEGMQLDANGQPQRIPGAPTAGQNDMDKTFAESYNTYVTAGGAQSTKNSLKTIDGVLKDLKTGKLQTGGRVGALALEGGEPSLAGKLLMQPVLVARTNISSSILPQAKPLFGARVTNFDAQALINSQGLDPMADNQTNITKLELLKQRIKAGQQDVENGGRYFQQHGTLAGYQPQALQQTNIPEGARQASDGNFYVPDPARPGKYLMVQ